MSKNWEPIVSFVTNEIIDDLLPSVDDDDNNEDTSHGAKNDITAAMSENI